MKGGGRERRRGVGSVGIEGSIDAPGRHRRNWTSFEARSWDVATSGFRGDGRVTLFRDCDLGLTGRMVPDRKCARWIELAGGDLETRNAVSANGSWVLSALSISLPLFRPLEAQTSLQRWHIVGPHLASPQPSTSSEQCRPLPKTRYMQHLIHYLSVSVT